MGRLAEFCSTFLPKKKNKYDVSKAFRLLPEYDFTRLLQKYHLLSQSDIVEVKNNK